MATRIVLFVVLCACLLDVIYGQGLILSDTTTLGAASTVAQLQKILSASRAWKQSYRLRPAAACRQSGTLCATTTSSTDDSSRYAQLMLATSPAAYETKILSPVQTQSSCNSCTAFAITAAAEAAIASVLKLKDFKLNSFSAHDFYFCSQDNPRSCSNGLSLPSALRELQDRQQKLLTQACMPYKPDFKEELRQDQLCAAQCNSTNPYAQLGRFGYKRLGSVWAIQAHIRQYGAAVARFDVYDDLDKFFEKKENVKKVYAPENKVKLLQYHAVIITGYNNAEGYWLVQSSWGPEYADNGRFRVAFGAAALDTEVYGVVFRPDALERTASVVASSCFKGSTEESVQPKNCAIATSTLTYRDEHMMGTSIATATYGLTQHSAVCASGVVGRPADDSILLCVVNYQNSRMTGPQPLVSINWPDLMLNVTPWSDSCYQYTAVDGDSLSMVAWKAGLPLERFMLDNVDVIKDLDTPITGKQLLVCATDSKGIDAVRVELHGVFVDPRTAGPPLPAQAESCTSKSPPPAITALKVAKLGATGVLITWSAPDRSHCITTTHVSITYKYAPNTLQKPRPVLAAFVEPQFPPKVQLLCCLTTGVAYVVRVAASNGAGLGPVVIREFVHGQL